MKRMWSRVNVDAVQSLPVLGCSARASPPRNRKSFDAPPRAGRGDDDVERAEADAMAIESTR